MQFKHKGYTLVQNAIPINYHYMIFDNDGHMVMHVPYNKPVTDEEAKKFIEHCIYLVKNGLSLSFSC